MNPENKSNTKSFTMIIIAVIIVIIIGIGIYATFFRGKSTITGNAISDSKDKELILQYSKNTTSNNTKIPNLTTKNNQNTQIVIKEITLNEDESLYVIKELILLREESENKNIIKIAEHYNNIDIILEKTALATSWQSIASCAYDGCDNIKYINMIQQIAHSTSEPKIHTQEINSIIETYYLWDGKNQALFSQSIVKTNTLMDAETSDVKNSWNDLVACNGCADSTEKVITIISKIVNG